MRKLVVCEFLKRETVPITSLPCISSDSSSTELTKQPHQAFLKNIKKCGPLEQNIALFLLCSTLTVPLPVCTLTLGRK